MINMNKLLTYDFPESSEVSTGISISMSSSVVPAN